MGSGLSMGTHIKTPTQLKQEIMNYTNTTKLTPESEDWVTSIHIESHSSTEVNSSNRTKSEFVKIKTKHGHSFTYTKDGFDSALQMLSSITNLQNESIKKLSQKIVSLNFLLVPRYNNDTQLMEFELLNPNVDFLSDISSSKENVDKSGSSDQYNRNMFLSGLIDKDRFIYFIDRIDLVGFYNPYDTELKFEIKFPNSTPNPLLPGPIPITIPKSSNRCVSISNKRFENNYKGFKSEGNIYNLKSPRSPRKTEHEPTTLLNPSSRKISIDDVGAVHNTQTPIINNNNNNNISDNSIFKDLENSTHISFISEIYNIGSSLDRNMILNFLTSIYSEMNNTRLILNKEFGEFEILDKNGLAYSMILFLRNLDNDNTAATIGTNVITTTDTNSKLNNIKEKQLFNCSEFFYGENYVILNTKKVDQIYNIIKHWIDLLRKHCQSFSNSNLVYIADPSKDNEFKTDVKTKSFKLFTKISPIIQRDNIDEDNNNNNKINKNDNNNDKKNKVKQPTVEHNLPNNDKKNKVKQSIVEHILPSPYNVVSMCLMFSITYSPKEPMIFNIQNQLFHKIISENTGSSQPLNTGDYTYIDLGKHQVYQISNDCIPGGDADKDDIEDLKF